MPPIVQGQRFPSLAEFKKALREWAIEGNFTPAILDSDTHRVRAGCRSSPDCPFRIRANFLEKRGHAKVTTCDDIHNCTSNSGLLPANQGIKRAETSRLAFLVDAVPRLITVDEETSTKTIMEAVEQKYGQKIALRQAQKVKKVLVPTSKGPCKHCGQSNHTSGRCPQHRRFSGNDSISLQENSFGNEGDGMHIESEREQPQSQEIFCDLCLQPGHERSECQTDDNTLATNGSFQTGIQRLPINDQAGRTATTTSQRPPESSSLDPNIVNGDQNLAPGTQQASQTQSSSHGVDAMSRVATQNPTRNPQDTRMEAARLMQQAARLMQEAARLNAEAARLTASVAHS
ncbi:hypothetical protein MMC24_006210 [Lignoscripta atroalba]|nr:hypothetical protein [Lignoscripta atroalba]